MRSNFPPKDLVLDMADTIELSLIALIEFLLFFPET
jgi:hypothetical protein